jgi:hypothetical protein
VFTLPYSDAGFSDGIHEQDAFRHIQQLSNRLKQETTAVGRFDLKLCPLADDPPTAIDGDWLFLL